MKANRAVTKDKDLNVGWPTEAEASWIIEHKDDPEEESPQSYDETAEKLWSACRGTSRDLAPELVVHHERD